MRILDGARKHGIADEDMLHAARVPLQDWDLDDDAIMRVGPARNGQLLEIGITDVDTDDPAIFHAMHCRDRFKPIPVSEQTMHTDEDIQRLQKLAEEFDPSTTPGRDASDLRAIAETADSIQAGEARLRELVQVARARGRSWGEIGIALGVSRQAAHERFADKIHA